MYKNKKIVALIPARKGSKGIPNKNITLLNGIPLIEHTIKQANDVEIIDKIIISTDSEVVFGIGEKYNIEIKGLRPYELATDTANLYDVIKYEIGNYNLVENEYEILVLLQPTSPLRQSYMIEDSLKNFIDNNQESAVSVSEVEEHPIFMRTINEENNLVKILNTDSTVRRQDLPKYYRVNGMIYINKVLDIVSEYVSFNDNISPIIIPREYAVDIDEIHDIKIAEDTIFKIKKRVDN